MTYNPNIPQAGDIPSQSQLQILTNFNQVNTVFGVDHYTFNEPIPGDRGLHRFLHLEVQAGDAVTTPTQVSLYDKNDGIAPNLYYRRSNNGSVIKMTSNADPIAWSPGCSFLPGGILIQWGLAALAGGTTTVNFPVAFSAPPWMAVATAYNVGGQTVSTEVFTALTFNIYTTTPGMSASWIAIGPA